MLCVVKHDDLVEDLVKMEAAWSSDGLQGARVTQISETLLGALWEPLRGAEAST